MASWGCSDLILIRRVDPLWAEQDWQFGGGGRRWGLLDMATERQDGSISVRGLSDQQLAALEALASTWSQEEADAFTAAIAPLEQVDSELWA